MLYTSEIHPSIHPTLAAGMTFGLRERESEWQIPFPNVGNGNENSISNFREREWEWQIPFPTFGNRNGSGKLYFRLLGMQIPVNS